MRDGSSPQSSVAGLNEVLRLVGASRAYAALSPADREDAIQIACVEALTWHRREGSFHSSQGDPLPAYQVAHRLARQAAAQMRKLRAREAGVLGDAPCGGDGGGSLLDLQPAREIEDPLERILATETGFGALRQELLAGRTTNAVRAYVRCVLNDEDLAAVAAETGTKVNTIAQANARIHARIVERGAGMVPARRPRCGSSRAAIASHAEVAAHVEAERPLVRAIARLLRHGELRRRDGRPDWEAIAGALQVQGHGVGSSTAVSAAWQEFLLSLPPQHRRHAVGQVRWGLRLRDVPKP
jgi:hypothetical protein